MRFESQADLARYLFDRAVKPKHTGIERLRLALMAAAGAEVLWNKYAQGGEEER